MKVLVAYSSSAGNARKLAETIATGAREAGATVELVDAGRQKPLYEAYEFVFLGCDALLSFDSKLLAGKLEGKKIALFASRSGLAKKALDEVLASLKQRNVGVVNTFVVQPLGPLAFLGFGEVKEADLIRARGFGERTTNTAFNVDVRKNNDKASRISGYLQY